MVLQRLRGQGLAPVAPMSDEHIGIAVLRSGVADDVRRVMPYLRQFPDSCIIRLGDAERLSVLYAERGKRRKTTNDAISLALSCLN